MPLIKLKFRVESGASQNARLDQILADRLPAVFKQTRQTQSLNAQISRGKVRKLIVAGAVYLEGKRCRIASKVPRAGAQVEVYVDPEKWESGKAGVTSTNFQMTADWILFEDEYLIAFNKPAGLPTQPTLDEARQNLYQLAKKYLSAREQIPEVYLGLHHRLDRDTSGVVLMTKVKEANVGVAKMFSEHQIEKVYNAITAKPEHGHKNLPKAWSVRNYLGKINEGKRAKWGPVRAGGDPALTDFRLLEEFSRGLLIEAKPHTGRTHQIRVHLSDYRILGDRLYGEGAPVEAPRVMLHALSLTFTHPIKSIRTSIESPIPEDFSQCLRALRENTISPKKSKK